MFMRGLWCESLVYSTGGLNNATKQNHHIEKVFYLCCSCRFSVDSLFRYTGKHKSNYKFKFVKMLNSKINRNLSGKVFSYFCFFRNSAHIAPAIISVAPNICSGRSCSFKNINEKKIAESGSR